MVILKNWSERTGWFIDEHNESVNRFWGLWRRYIHCVLWVSQLCLSYRILKRIHGPKVLTQFRSSITKGRDIQISRVHFNCYSITVNELILKSHLDQTPTFGFSNLPNQVHGLTPSHQMTEANAVFLNNVLCSQYQAMHEVQKLSTTYTVFQAFQKSIRHRVHL